MKNDPIWGNKPGGAELRRAILEAFERAARDEHPDAVTDKRGHLV